MTQAPSAPPEPSDGPLPALLRLRRAGLVVIAVVVGITVAQHPAPSLSATGLGVLLCLLGLFGATVVLGRLTGPRIDLVALGAMILSSSALVWLQPAGAGMAGLFVAASFAAMRLPEQRSIALVLIAGAMFVPAAIHAHRSGGMIAGTELGIAAFYLLARFARDAAQAHQQTRQLLVRLEASRNAEAEAAALRERSRLARDMHDVLAHSLSGLMLQLEGARMLSSQAQANGQLPDALDRAHHLARAGLEEARRAIAALRDEDLPGPDRLEQLVADFERDSSIPTSLETSGEARHLDSETSLTVYRVAQEALTNVRKHAKPDRVELHLTYATDGTRLTIHDRAEQPSQPTVASRLPSGGYGLTGMRERAELLGGTLGAEPTADGYRVELGFRHERATNDRADRRRSAGRTRGPHDGPRADARGRDRRQRSRWRGSSHNGRATPPRRRPDGPAHAAL
jgi:signal transduction histidine kinase